MRGRDGVKVIGDDLPPDVEQIAVRPVWQLSDAEERRTKQVDVRFVSAKKTGDEVLVGGNRSEQGADRSNEPRGQRSARRC